MLNHLKRFAPLAVLITILLVGFPRVHAQGKAHSITLTWVASTSTNVTNYNVYRSTTSGSGYAKIGNVASPTTLTYTDSSGTGGTTYYYVVTALDSGGDESADSNQASAVFLANPNPPTGLAAVSN
jgi:fibronectin type 3 domain-containing protein